MLWAKVLTRRYNNKYLICRLVKGESAEISDDFSTFWESNNTDLICPSLLYDYDEFCFWWGGEMSGD